MFQRRQLAPHAVLVFEINWRDDDAFLIRRAREHASPWIDDHRIAVVTVAINVGAELGGCDHVRLILDRAGAEQRLPMRFAGWESECARNRDDLCAGKSEAPIEFREAQVVADAESDRAERSLGGNDVGAGRAWRQTRAPSRGREDRRRRDESCDRLRFARRRGRAAPRCCSIAESPATLGDRSGYDMNLKFAREPRHQRRAIHRRAFLPPPLARYACRAS